jgi:hypothetical protein
MGRKNRRVLATGRILSIGSRRPYHLHAGLNQTHCPRIFMLAQRVLVSFGAQSFPRKRESTPQAIGNRPPTDWIPAFAGMTSVSKGIPFQMTPLLPSALMF